MTSITELLKRDKKLQEMDEPSGPQSERQGLWRVLAAGVALGVAAMLALAWLLV